MNIATAARKANMPGSRSVIEKGESGRRKKESNYSLKSNGFP
ncbi:hypothetical protein HCH_06897 [Hahella chejuensis KCTC 2396]|uniref:Uncharacterized protein n=1 Tax=Hahella chejuensis (strain KCTC 2396) TaxID=349521 RepID=Q2S759_HAHCH|nr:hypothetical protein HCH_06897 [Hahella chejuensis KCTC 2396]